MATYTAIRNLFDDSALLNRVAVAVIVAANTILEASTPTVAEKAWAAKAFAGPEAEAKRIIMSVLAANKSATVTQIQNANDTALQNNVDAAINLFVDADAGV